MELALRVLGLMCDGQNRTLQVNCKKKLSTIFTIVTKQVEISELGYLRNISSIHVLQTGIQ